MGKTRGFTLIELMVTIAVLAVIAMMAAPKMSEMIAKQNLILTVRDLSSTLNEARSKAVLIRKDVRVTFNDTTKSSKNNTDTQMYWLAKTGNALTASSATSIIFTSYGLVKDATNDSDLVICNSDLHITKTISVSRMGTIVVKSDGAC
ncbi:prepilin-type cleavage/methylation N-terminal domain protein [Acinetobacter sp. WC-323]|uniref:GspH/FimT family pseudopilin n=1 Tax=Acinetobacter sp. WC-323 TaxID=903918 RepID=UPI00029E9ED1|nr:GspH/FimT family pseudopilin [Acinetobacter sp. WC-323]EKU60455.1 prepilin-type cleavage/methylation N-terminal domain protein [Acinetobacter sp. WC-323]